MATEGNFKGRRRPESKGFRKGWTHSSAKDLMKQDISSSAVGRSRCLELKMMATNKNG